MVGTNNFKASIVKKNRQPIVMYSVHFRQKLFYIKRVFFKKTVHIRGAIGGKTSKTAVLP